MKSAAITILVLLIMVVLGFMLFSFQLRQIESALLTTFGEPKRQITEPGLYFRWPAPIQNVHKFDSRQRLFEADTGETTTKEATPVIVNTYVVWRIVRPLDFFNSVGTVREARSKLLSQISDTQNKVIGRHSFGEFVNSNPDKIRFKGIEDEMLEVIKGPVLENYGIEITHLGIKQLKISEDVSKDVFERMRAERSQRVEAIISEGNAEATRIKSDADSKKSQLLSAAEARAKAIRGSGDAEAAKYYKQLEEDPELAMFLRDIEALKKILEKRSTVILSGDTEPFRLLKEMPDIEPDK